LTGLLPSREDDYRVTPEMVRSAELFSFVFGDLAQRLKEREALEATFEALIEEGTTAALTQIATNVAPQLAALQDDILAAQAEIEAILGTGEISPFVKVNILPAADEAAILAALGIPALFDTLRSEIMGGAPAAALDTIYELAERLAEDGDAIAAINAAIATKLNASAVSAWVLGNLLAAGDKETARAALGVVMDAADKAKLDGLSPADLVGAITFFGTTTPPPGWLKANGAAVSRASYASLFARFGTTFGVGDGSTTFNLPDLRGEFLRSLDDGRGVDIGRGLGSVQMAALPNHRHSVAGGGGTAGFYATDTEVYGSYDGGANTNRMTGSGIYDTSGELRPRNVALLACVKY
jgi:microcystin-dependent protein